MTLADFFSLISVGGPTRVLLWCFLPLEEDLEDTDKGLVERLVPLFLSEFLRLRKSLAEDAERLVRRLKIPMVN